MRTIIITGASDGIGKSIAKKLSSNGSYLLLFGRDKKRLEKTAEACRKSGSKVEIFAFDLNDSKLREKIVADITRNYKIDILINNAGIWHKAGDLTTISDAVIRSVINTNLTSQILLTKQLLSVMRVREKSAIINIVSKSGLIPQFGQTVYTASKYGMKGFTDVLREDTKDEPIRIAGVYQSGTRTELFKKAGETFPNDDFTEPDDLAEVVAFMLSRPEKLWINEIHITK